MRKIGIMIQVGGCDVFVVLVFSLSVVKSNKNNKMLSVNAPSKSLSW